ncbi:aspartyl-phosphate phosphatase Spo0E family protein [Virgibacillus doumboii]|uniref:aspartyl-phosphate phosphatase Spo0E family protein n=1 Tax=Virgibacillus doumboii TaxID=2697503 RepID=UPI0013DEC8F5|nr:aspartyl-phosphate phosphatase Spo0E family protein [Virgibacillus doumboii]
MCSTENLLEQIEFLRKQMSDVALKKGFTSIESISLSQELDRLLNQYNDMKRTQHHKKID